MQAVALGLLLVLLLLGAALAARQEIVDVFHRTGRLGRHCQAHAAACRSGDARECVRALQNLEAVELGLISWRTHFVASVFVALMTLLVAVACRVPPGPALALLATAFLASSVAFRHQHSWNGAHVAKHTREARQDCLQTLAAADTVFKREYY